MVIYEGLTVRGSRTRTSEAQLPSAARGRPNSAAGSCRTDVSTLAPDASYWHELGPYYEWLVADLLGYDPLGSGRAVCTVISLNHVEHRVHGVRDEFPGEYMKEG